MEIINIQAKYNKKIVLPKESFKEFIDLKIGLVTTIQYLEQLPNFQEIIPNSIIGGQILGCNVNKAKDIKDKIDAFLYIGTGKFHPLAIAYYLKKEVFIYNPITTKIEKINESQVQKYQKKLMGRMNLFLNAKNIGILITTKPGQEKIKNSKELKQEILNHYPEKNIYFFIGDMITPYECENFPFIDCFINTACPRIIEDDFKKPIINYDEVKDLLTQI